MRRFVLTVIFVLTIVNLSSAQNYKTGIGIRGGLYTGLTLKHFVSSNAAFEGLLSTRWRGFDLTGLYEIEAEAFDAKGLSWYYGGGAHIGFYNGSHTDWGIYGTSYTVVGIDGVLGLEYTFPKIPLNIGLDWKPFINLIGYTGFWPDGGALSIRYVF
jgi:hypothetical protein